MQTRDEVKSDDEKAVHDIQMTMAKGFDGLSIEKGNANRMHATAIKELVDWTVSEGANLDMVEVRYCGEDRGCGVFARTNIRTNEVFIRIPRHLMITAGLVAEMPDYKQILQRHRLQPFPILVMFFYLESKKGNSSFFKYYFKCLPKVFDTPLAYNNTATVDTIPVEQLPARTKQLLQKQHGEFVDLKLKLENVIDELSLDLKHLNWAWHVVNTRCVYSENEEHPIVDNSDGDTLAIIPVMDMLNHDPNAQAVAYFDKKSQTYCVAADYKSVTAGEEIYVCYGPHDNSRLWVEYGFSLPENIFNRVEVSPALFVALAKSCDYEVTPDHEKLIMELAITKKNAKNLVFGELHENKTIRNMAYAICEKLQKSLESKADLVKPCYRNFWIEQVDILKNIAKMRESVEDSDTDVENSV